ncbi:chitin deacetylase, carbohydrate esterase family 4 protein [Pseudohyphozyma bogoriensis]|nr:chitin deacetylase, carbohydrate esterase family 4 protein [Pseudohyphozyma bogoriensis]
MKAAILPLLALPLALAHPSVSSIAAKLSTTSKAAAVASASAGAASAATTGSRSTEAQEAAIKGAAAECTPYDFPIADQLVTADLSKTTISAADRALFTSIEAGIPNIAPRGDRAGNFTGVAYSDADPDCWWSWNKCTTPKIAGIPADVTRCEEPNTWGFTLDDDIGSNVMDWPLEAQRGLTDGHEICSHTWSHPYMTSMTNEQAFAELYFSKKAIKDILGITVRCWRPPYGDVDDRIRYIAQQLDMTTIVWEEDTNDYDWSVVGVAEIDANYNSIIAKGAAGNYSKEGTIVLTHEIDGETMLLSEQFLPTIRSTFKGGVMPVAVCMNNTRPYVENTSYIYPNYEQYIAGTRSISLLAPTANANAASAAVVHAASTATSQAAAATSSTIAKVVTTASTSSSASSTSAAPAAAATTAKTAGAATLVAGGLSLALAFVGGVALLA